MSLRSPLGRVLGLGAAKDGTHHWWLQRVTSVALALLGTWFVVSLLAMPDLRHATLVAWLGQPMTATLMTLLVLVVAHHSVAGMQVVIEDYVHGHGTKLLALLANQFAHAVAAVAGVVAVLRIALGGPA